MSILQKLKNATIPSIYTSVASVGLYYVLIDNNLNHQVPFANMQLPTWAAVGAASFLGSEIGSLVTEFVAPKIPLVKNFEGIEMAIIPAAVSGLSTWLVMKTLISPDTEFKNAFLIGAGGGLAGQTLYDSMNK